MATYPDGLLAVRSPISRIGRKAAGAGLHGRQDGCVPLDPFLVARIEFLEWTPDNRLRHPRFAGIRSDKDAWEVVRE
jgi:ATP-dependent DNA ligase